jgi:hypothetical protein
MSLRIRLSVFAVGAALIAGAQAPTPVVERSTTHFGRMTRVSLFSNQVVVVAIHSETEDFNHNAFLDADEYMLYLQTLEEAAGTIGDHPVTSDVESRDSISTLALHVGPGAPQLFRYSPLASLDLSLSRISAVVDDLQTRALNTLPGEHEIKQWQPKVGDCVELRQGGEACVSRVEEDGTIELRRDDVIMTYTVTPDDRSFMILNVIEPTS